MKSSQAWVTVLLAVSGLQALAIAGLIAAAPKSTQTAAVPPAPVAGLDGPHAQAAEQLHPPARTVALDLCDAAY